MDKDELYKILVPAWSSGTASYHSLFSAYLTANSVFVVASGLLARLFLSNGNDGAILLIILFVCVAGIFVSVQMLIALARFSGQNGYFEWILRSIEKEDDTGRFRVFVNLYDWRENKANINYGLNEFKPNWAVKIHRLKVFSRAKTLPFIFVFLHVFVISVVLVKYCG